jgi:hypothetical protein
MKNRFLRNASLLLIVLCGCSKNSSKDIAHQINSSYTFQKNNSSITHECLIDKKESKFVWNYIGPSDGTDYFYFDFSFEDTELINSGEFDYSTSAGEKVEFNHTDSSKINKFQFAGSLTIEISYSNASSDIKSIIDNNTYTLDICNVKWFSKPELFL